MKKLIIVIAVAASAVGCNVQNIDVGQPVAAADKLYGSLQAGDSKAALAQFSPTFKSKVDSWSRLLRNLQSTHGPVTAAELRGAILATNNDDPCYALTYAVKRGSFASDETLFLCSKGGASTWLIHGHGMVRLDSKQSISAGVLPSEVGIHVP